MSLLAVEIPDAAPLSQERLREQLAAFMSNFYPDGNITGIGRMGHILYAARLVERALRDAVSAPDAPKTHDERREIARRYLVEGTRLSDAQGFLWTLDIDRPESAEETLVLRIRVGKE